VRRDNPRASENRTKVLTRSSRQILAPPSHFERCTVSGLGPRDGTSLCHWWTPSAAVVSTTVAIASRNLYVLVRAFDPHPDSIVALLSWRLCARSRNGSSSSSTAITIAEPGVELTVNPVGVKRDFAILNDVLAVVLVECGVIAGESHPVRLFAYDSRFVLTRRPRRGGHGRLWGDWRLHCVRPR
jgi:hypothetical protein